MTEIETSRELSRADVAAYLREFADQLDAKGTHEADGTTRSDRERTNPAETRPDDRTTATNATSDTGRDRSVEPSENAERTDTDSGADVGHRTKYDKVTFYVGDDSATINPPETMTLDVAVDSDSAMLTSASRRSVDFHLEWDADAVDDGDELHIE
ncbi:hypothetical protein SAMN04487948_103271 [Halogranum amylolyticum]|uniref:Amphi-Trp domain-containing protein n=1 Tax=Halogranum amylolyticum TaxID=660520 RepID=A0A1H8QS77_9EURY|nr:amphi-Trp domain-containing protein [Halogranum amylolyticum]SEO56838.1 hypothetical protein SAMN04487948_103271 [Halogranum amylolyticum]